MHELILIRYAEYSDGHITPQGVKVMQDLAVRLEPVIAGKRVILVTADVPRAIESTAVLAAALTRETEVMATPLLYAADEEGVLPDITSAASYLTDLSKHYETILAIASREYIAELPHHFLKNAPAQTILERGQAMRIEPATRTCEVL